GGRELRRRAVARLEAGPVGGVGVGEHAGAGAAGFDEATGDGADVGVFGAEPGSVGGLDVPRAVQAARRLGHLLEEVGPFDPACGVELGQFLAAGGRGFGVGAAADGQAGGHAALAPGSAVADEDAADVEADHLDPWAGHSASSSPCTPPTSAAA